MAALIKTPCNEQISCNGMQEMNNSNRDERRNSQISNTVETKGNNDPNAGETDFARGDDINFIDDDDIDNINLQPTDKNEFVDPKPVPTSDNNTQIIAKMNCENFERSNSADEDNTTPQCNDTSNNNIEQPQTTDGIPKVSSYKNIMNLTVNIEKDRLSVPGSLNVGSSDCGTDPESNMPASPPRDITIEIPKVTFNTADVDIDEVKSPMFRSPSLQRLWSVISQSDQVEEKFKEKELRLKMFIVFLFLVILGAVITTWVLHRGKLLEIELGKTIIFNERTRELQIKSFKQKHTLYGYLGNTISTYHLPIDCTSQQNKSREICLKWKNIGILDIMYQQHNDGTKCYKVSWKGLNPNFVAKDCFLMSGSHWYGGPTMQSKQSWPIEKMNFNETVYLSGYNPFGSVTERYWLSSDGIAITVDANVHLHVSMQKTNKHKQLCFMSKAADEVHASNTQRMLNYTVCSGENMQRVHRFKEKYRNTLKRFPGEKLMKIPIIRIDLRQPYKVLHSGSSDKRILNSSEILDYINRVPSLSNAQIELYNWQMTNGDFHNLQTGVETFLNDLYHKGHPVILNMDTFCDVFSKAFQEGLTNDYWVKDSGDDVAGLFRWDGKTQTVLDVTNPSARQWFIDRLQKLQNRYNISSFKFSSGEVKRLPKYAHFKEPLQNINVYTMHYVNMASSLGPLTQINVAFATQHVPVYTNVGSFQWSWDGIKSVIPTVLTYSLQGYPFIASEMPEASTAVSSISKRNLYIRWLQLSAFLPVMKITPHFDNAIVNIINTMIEIHKTFTVPNMLKLEQEFNKTRDPIVRPIWWLAPNDAVLQQIDDQFLIGNSIMVAPVLKDSLTHRVYIPIGRWKRLDAIQVITGPKWVQFNVTLSSFPYFIKI